MIQHTLLINNLFYARFFFWRNLTRSIFELMKYWEKIFLNWILIFTRRNLFLRKVKLKKTLNWSLTQRNKSFSAIFKSLIFLFFFIFAILFVDAFFFSNQHERVYENCLNYVNKYLNNHFLIYLYLIHKQINKMMRFRNKMINVMWI